MKSSHQMSASWWLWLLHIPFALHPNILFNSMESTCMLDE
jgi:hypothetical protein